MSLELLVGELRGEVKAIHADIASIKRDVRTLVNIDNRRKGGWAVLSIIGGFFGAFILKVFA